MDAIPCTMLLCGMISGGAGQTIGMVVVGPSVVQSAISSGVALSYSGLMTNIAIATAPIIVPAALLGGGIGVTAWTVNKIWNYFNN